jgi:hypothetical protein
MPTIPKFTSQAQYLGSCSVVPFLCQSRFRPIEIFPSTSWLACQK